VRRDVVGGKRGDGHRLQRESRRVRRPDASRIRVGRVDASLTAVGGLAAFGAFLRNLGVDAALAKRFRRLKSHGSVVYPMATQLRMLIDVTAAGEPRVFGLESLAADPLFAMLAGGSVPSLDTVYRDLRRFDPKALDALETMVSDHGLAELEGLSLAEVHIDIDSTVDPLFGSQEGALPGPNPRYHGRPSYHPLIARAAEVDTIIGARLRPGDTSFGASDVDFVTGVIRDTRAKVGGTLICVRIDGAADCTEMMSAIEDGTMVTIIQAAG